MSYEPQVIEKIRAFYHEFPFLAELAEPEKTYSINVSRVNLELLKKCARRNEYYIFSPRGILLGKAKTGEKVQACLQRIPAVDSIDVGYIVGIHRISPSLWGYGLLDWLLRNYHDVITVFKAPKSFDLTTWLEVEQKEYRQEARKAADTAT